MRLIGCLPLWLALASGPACSGEQGPGEDGDPPANETSGASSDETTEASSPDPPATSEDPLDIGFPDYRAVSPTLLRIVNERAEPLRLVISHGDGQPFSIEPRAGEPRFSLGDAAPTVTTAPCACRCGFDCALCEPPQHRETTVDPGGHFDFPWSGRVRVFDEGCFHPYGAPAGPRTFTACLDDLAAQPRDCVSVDATLPAERIELRFAAADG